MWVVALRCTSAMVSTLSPKGISPESLYKSFNEHLLILRIYFYHNLTKLVEKALERLSLFLVYIKQVRQLWEFHLICYKLL